MCDEFFPVGLIKLWKFSKDKAPKFRWTLFGLMTCFIGILITSCSENESSYKKLSGKDTVSIRINTAETEEIYSRNIFDDSALFYQCNSQYEKAIYYYIKAGDCYRRDNAWERYVIVLSWLGCNYVWLSNPDSAYYYLDKARTMASKKIPDSKNALAYIYYAFGYYYWNSYFPDKSIESFNKALQLWQKPNDLFLCYNTLGNFYLTVFKDYKKAEEYYFKALKMHELDSSIESRRVAYCYYGIAIANQRIGDYVKANTYIYQAIDLYSSIDDNYKLEICYSALGLIQSDMEKYDDAISNQRKALRLNLRNEGSMIDRAYHMLNIAYPYLAKEQFSEAVKYYKQAIQLLINKNRDITSTIGLTDSYMYLGMAYKSLNKPDSTLYYYNKCINVSRNFFGAKHSKLSDAYQFLGNYYAETGMYDSALYYYQSAMIANVPEFNEREISKNPLMKQIGYSSSLYDVLSAKADALMQKYYHSPLSITYLYKALNCYSLCDSLMIRRKHILDYDKSKLKFTEVCHKNYEKYLECLYEIYKLDKNVEYISCALNAMENNKSVLLENALKQAEALSDVGIPDSIRRKMEMLNKTITYLDGFTSEKDNLLKDTIQKQLFDARRKQERLREYIEKTYPVYSYYKYQSSNMELSDIKSRLKLNQYLIEYFQGERNIYAISISKANVVFYKYQRTQALDSIISVFRRTVSVVPELTELENNFQLFTQSSYNLYKALISPLIPHSTALPYRESPQLIIVPEGELALIPFEALIDTLPKRENIDFKVLPYLIRSFYVSYDYSANLLFNKISGRSNSDKVLAFGAANGQEGDEDSIKSSINNLPGSSNELQAISKSMDGVFYKGRDATESNFKSHASQYDIIHLALHGSADVNNANNCKVFFTSEGKSTEDGILNDYEVYALNLNARLAVLTACETGLGKYYKGEGVFSIARGFIYAGCPSVVMSYWKIPDLMTAQQVNYFYQHLKKGEYVFEALRNAKINYLDRSDNITAHPANWASLNVWGKSDIRLHKRTHLLFYVSFGGLLILLIFIFRMATKHKKTKI